MEKEETKINGDDSTPGTISYLKKEINYLKMVFKLS